MYNDLKSAIEFFKNDKFAASTGVEILSVETGRAVCALEISQGHVNSDGFGQSSRLPIPLSPSPQILVQRTIAASLPHKVISISFRQPPREGSLPRPFAYATNTAFRFIGLPCPTKRTIRLPSRRSPDIRLKNNYFPHSCGFFGSYVHFQTVFEKGRKTRRKFHRFRRPDAR